jgi:hypothetical protein
MLDINTLQKQFAELANSYNAIKQATEAQTVKWLWASDSIFDMEPFYFEEHKFSRGKILKDTPINKANKFHYGYDAKDEVIVIREYLSKEDWCYETFINRSPAQIENYRFGYGSDKKLDNFKTFWLENDVFKGHFSVNLKNWHQCEYQYEQNKMVSKHIEILAQGFQEPQKRVFNFAYDEFGILESIKEDEHFLYQNSIKGISFRALSALAETKLFEVLKQNIIARKIPDCLFCLNLSYGSEHILPPCLCFGTESEQQSWIASEGNEAKKMFWNTAEYKHQIDMDLDKETEAFFDFYSQETVMRNKENEARKVIIDCLKRLKNTIHSFELNTTDDFVLIATDFENIDIKKNFKAINPELFENFKKILI